MKKTVAVFVAFALLYVFVGGPVPGVDILDAITTTAEPDAGTASRAPATMRLVDGEQARGNGSVVRVLSDDNDGNRHQRFILQLETGRTLLIAHNIDLAPRIPDLRPGDRVEFYGVFETNPQGGVIHWTHHDPQGQHIDGWLRHNGVTYQ